MDTDTAATQALLGRLTIARERATRTRAADVWCAGLTALVCAAGAVLFLTESDIEGNPFDSWAYWCIAGGIAGMVVVLVRHFRGVRRASGLRLAARLVALLVLVNVASLFAGYGWGSLGTHMPFVFPAAAAGVVGAVAFRRGDLRLAGVFIGLGVAIVTAGMRAQIEAGPSWWFDNNFGYALCSAIVAVASGFVAARWHREVA